MDRYAILLKYAHSLDVDRGASFWQRGEQAVAARDALAHYHIRGAPSLNCRDLWAHLESITLLWIVPSVQVERTIYWEQYDCYEMIAELQPFLHDFEERPLHKDWSRGAVSVPAPMDGLDDSKYPPAGNFDPSQFSLRATQKHEE